MALVDWYGADDEQVRYRRYHEKRNEKKYIRFILLDDIECKCYLLPDTRMDYRVWKLQTPDLQWGRLFYSSEK